MLEVLTITFPVFAAIAIGFGAVGAGVFTGTEMRVLGRYVMNIALPALLFSTVATRDLGEVLHPGYLAAMALGGLATLAVGYAVLTATGTGPARRAVAMLGTTVPNSGFIGYPLLLLAFPEVAGQALALNFLVENFLMLPLGLAALEFSRPRAGRSLAAVLGRIFLNVLSKPFVIALLLGLGVSALGLPLPAAMTRLLELLGASASALALVVIGGTLHGTPVRGNRVLAAEIAAGKLLLHPAMVALAAMALPALGIAALPAEMLSALIVSAAVPMFGIYVVLAQPYGHDDVASMAILAAVVGAFFTLTGLVAVLG